MIILRVFLFICFSGFNSAFAFVSYEHSEIGREGFKQALKQANRIRRGLSRRLLSGQHLSQTDEAIGAVADGKVFARFTFGDLVAIYGDYAVAVGEVNNPDFAKRASRLKTIVRGEGSNDAERDHSIQLSVNNPTHFSLRAAQAYIRWHRHALLIARQKNRLWEALHYEALAVHSLTDLFAFGHIHDNRQLTDRLINWRNRQKVQAGLGVFAAGTASKLMGAYVNYFHSGYNWKGAMMQNLAGDSWRGFGDKKYRVVDKSCGETSKIGKRKCSDVTTARQREIIVHAVSISVLDVLKSAAGTSIRVGNDYKAMCHIPVRFWDSARPLPPERQKLAIIAMRNKMKKQNRPLEKHGFDFNLGLIKFDEKEVKGEVEYIDYVRQYCGKL